MKPAPKSEETVVKDLSLLAQSSDDWNSCIQISSPEEMRGTFSMTLRTALLRTNIWSAVAASMLCLTIHAVVQAQTAQPTDKPYVVEYYYKARWGYADEFIRLFKKNHYPFLRKLAESGKIVQVTGESPVYHATEDGRWDYRVRIVWKNVQVANDNAGDDQILKQLFPDQDTFKREEQRRFEILLAHWDVPIKSVNLDEK